MNVNNFGNTIEENELAENDVFNMFMSSFKRKVKFHPSLFENSFTQKITPQPTPNFSDHKSSKYMEFRLVSNEFLSDLHSLTGHIECKIVEKKSNGTLENLAAGNLVATIPSSIISNCIKNFRLFLYDRQLSPERTDRYSLISYFTQYFNSQLTNLKEIEYETGLYFDQSEASSLVTSEAKSCTKALYKAGAISRGHYDSGTIFAQSAQHTFCERLNSPFLWSQPNLLLPGVNFLKYFTKFTFQSFRESEIFRFFR